MTTSDVFKLITSVPKWYAGYTTAQNASNIKKRFEDKELSFQTLEEMFNHFGYHLSSSWSKPHEHIMGSVEFPEGSGEWIAKCTICGLM